MLYEVITNPQQQNELDAIARSQSLPAGFVLRAKILLLLADGFCYDAIKEKLDTTAPTIGCVTSCSNFARNQCSSYNFV